MFASKANLEKWLYDRSNWEQTRTDLNMTEVINYFEKGLNFFYAKDFPSEYLYKPCLTQEDAEYRLDIMGELLHDKILFENLYDYCAIMKRLRRLYLDYKDDKHDIQKQYRFLLLFGEYADDISRLKVILSNAKSPGLRTAYAFCSEITDSVEFKTVYNTAASLLSKIAQILKNVGMAINPYEKTVTVIDCEEAGETELLLKDIFDTYGLKIKSRFSIVDPLPLSYLEEKVLKILIDNNVDAFENLKTFYGKYTEFLDDIKNFIELLPQFVFYISYTEFAGTMKSKGMSVCKPEFDDVGFSASECAGASLIIKFLAENLPLEDIVCNDIRLPKGGIFILSGPNQGGKTIYLKALGLSAYLAKCGCYVFCKECRLPFYDNILTHFVQREILGKSRLVEEIERIEKISNEFNKDSLVLLNESFTSTRRKDSVEISIHYIKKFDEIGCSVGFVSHFYEIPEVYKSGENNIISLRSGVGENGRRTYIISEQKGDGLAYARDIARKYGMTYEQIMEDMGKT